jgi:hypothetical protein
MPRLAPGHLFDQIVGKHSWLVNKLSIIYLLVGNGQILQTLGKPILLCAFANGLGEVFNSLRIFFSLYLVLET